MPKTQRERRERTDNYHLLIQWCRTPEQRFYEQMRPVVLYGIPRSSNERRRPALRKARCVALRRLLIHTA